MDLVVNTDVFTVDTDCMDLVINTDVFTVDTAWCIAVGCSHTLGCLFIPTPVIIMIMQPSIESGQAKAML